VRRAPANGCDVLCRKESLLYDSSHNLGILKCVLENRLQAYSEDNNIKSLFAPYDSIQDPSDFRSYFAVLYFLDTCYESQHCHTHYRRLFSLF